MKHRDRRGGERRTGLGFGVVIGVVAAAGMLAACGGGSSGPQVASLGSDATTTTVKSASATGKGDPLAFSRCMRAHGLPDFPDPDPNGGITINSGGPGGKNLGPDAPAFKAAQKACASLAPGGGAATPAEKAKRRAEGLKMAQCMRAHGILDFPDPSADGGIAIEAKPGSDLAPNSPTFQAAQKVCMPNGPGKGSLHTSGGSGGSGGVSSGSGT